MPKPTEAYIANQSVRYLLIKLGDALGYKEFDKKKHKKEWEEILKYFEYGCCYCGEKNDLELDHIVGLNKIELGFDCIGNIAPACKTCNQNKNKHKSKNTDGYAWELHLKSVCESPDILVERKKRIEEYMRKSNYPPKVYENIREEIDKYYNKIKDSLYFLSDTFIEKIIPK